MQRALFLLRLVVIAAIAIIATRTAYSQELNCRVSLNIQTLSDVDRPNWESFIPDVEAYLNTFAWTTNFSGQKIQCTLGFNITGSNGSEYNAQVFIQSSRPMAGTKQTTTMARFFDDNLTFGYTRSMALQHGINYRELESFLDYYANIIIGLDQDSYTPEGGTPAFQQADQAALIANASQGTGWDRIVTATGAFSRVGYAEDILNANTRSLRDIWYNFHTTVLDEISVSEDTATINFAGIIDTLITMKRSSSDIDRSVYYKIVFNAKYTEFADFARWFKDNADLYFRKLKYIDPSHITFYDDALSKMN